MIRARVLIAVPAALMLALIACGSSSSDVAARIGDDDVSQQELTTAVGVYRSVFGAEQGPCGATDPAAEADPAACERAVLGDLILGRIAQTYADEHDLRVTDRVVDDAMASVEEQYGADALRAAFEDNGVTREDLAALVRSSLLQREVLNAVTADELGEDGLRTLYDERRGDFATIEVDHILVASEAEAREVYEQVTAPGSDREGFLALAGEVSTDPGVAENGGTYGPVAASTFDPTFAAAALDLEPGDVSQPVETGFGWHVIRLESAEVTPFEEAREQLIGQASSEVFGTWVKDRADDLSVEVNPRLGRFDQETLTVVKVGSTDPDSVAPTSASSGAAGG